MPAERLADTRLVVDDVDKVFGARRRGEEPVHAVDHVSFVLEPGASIGLVGASGSAKSTIARLITGLEKPDSGSVRLGDIRVERLRRGGLRRLRSQVQMVFQDPYAALNPLHTVSYTLTRPLANSLDLGERERRLRIRELLRTVGLTPVEQFEEKLPHQLSGGQRQRVVIARALACRPQVIVADEPVSMLDVSLRAGVLRLLGELRRDFGMSLLYITHDLLSARVVTDELLVLNRGRVVEHGPTKEVLQRPRDEYTRRLLAALPNPFTSDARPLTPDDARAPVAGRRAEVPTTRGVAR